MHRLSQLGQLNAFHPNIVGDLLALVDTHTAPEQLPCVVHCCRCLDSCATRVRVGALGWTQSASVLGRRGSGYSRWEAIKRRAPDVEKGVVVRQADFNAPETLGPAFAGAERVAIISTDAVAPGTDRVAQHSAAVDAAVLLEAP